MDILSYAMGKKAGGGGSTINNQDKTLTENGQYTADSGYTGLGTVTVNVPEPTGNINITDTNQTNVKNYATAQVVDADLVAGNIKKDVNILGVVGTYEGSGGEQLDLTTGTRFGSSTFSTLPTAIQNANWSSVTNFQNMFSSCSSLSDIQIDTSSGTNFNGAFLACTNLRTLSELNTSLANSISGMFTSCTNLTNLGGFKNLGQAYLTTQSANYNNYKLSITSSKLTHDSLMNVINKLYDIATAGCNAQSLIIGDTNLAKLTAEEISTCTSKGWSIS